MRPPLLFSTLLLPVLLPYTPRIASHSATLARRAFHASPLAAFVATPVYKMGSDASKNQPAGNFPKGKSESEWRTVLNPEQVCMRDVGA
jgi:hypothetical protein